MQRQRARSLLCDFLVGFFLHWTVSNLPRWFVAISLFISLTKVSLDCSALCAQAVSAAVSESQNKTGANASAYSSIAVNVLAD